MFMAILVHPFMLHFPEDLPSLHLLKLLLLLLSQEKALYLLLLLVLEHLHLDLKRWISAVFHKSCLIYTKGRGIIFIKSFFLQNPLLYLIQLETRHLLKYLLLSWWVSICEVLLEFMDFILNLTQASFLDLLHYFDGFCFGQTWWDHDSGEFLLLACGERPGG